MYTIHINPVLNRPHGANRNVNTHSALGALPSPQWVEIISLAERALNFAHTGSARVLHRTTGRPLWIAQAIADGLMPMFSPALMLSVREEKFAFTFDLKKWSLDRETRRPVYSAQKAIERHFGVKHFMVSKRTWSKTDIRKHMLSG